MHKENNNKSKQTNKQTQNTKRCRDHIAAFLQSFLLGDNAFEIQNVDGKWLLYA